MSSASVHHATITVRRIVGATPERVFAAWSDPQIYARWHVPGGDWVVEEAVHEFRDGGRIHSKFGPPRTARYETEGRYLSVDPPHRHISAGVMLADGKPGSASLCTIEVLPHRDGALVLVTDQSAVFDPEAKDYDAEREAGWNAILDKLVTELGVR
jgi:uncharacterized protein YndB with AHSA1/START domain